MPKVIDNIKKWFRDHKDLKRDKVYSRELNILKYMESEGLIERDKDLYDELDSVDKRGDTYGAVWAAIGSVMINSGLTFYNSQFPNMATITASPAAYTVATGVGVVAGFTICAYKDGKQSAQLRSEIFANHHTIFRDHDEHGGREEIIYSMYVEKKYERGINRDNYRIFLHLAPEQELKIKEAGFEMDDLKEFLRSSECKPEKKEKNVLVRYEDFRAWANNIYGIDPDNPRPEEPEGHPENGESIENIISFAEIRARMQTHSREENRTDARETDIREL